MAKRNFTALLYESTKQKCVNGIFTGTLEEDHTLFNHFTWLVQYDIHLYILG